MTQHDFGRFVVGTGRCGSTLLSEMLARHPAALSVFELFNGLDVGRRFSDAICDGEQMAQLLSAEQPFLTAVLRRGYAVPEVHYPFDTGRLSRRDGLPWMLVGALPKMHPDPDAFFLETRTFLRTLPPQAAAAHYRALFAWWTRQRGKRFWIERSGSSVEYLGSLRALFPEARFVHLHRDGCEVALSMREYPAYRLPVAVMYRAVGDGTEPPNWGELDFSAAPDPDDSLSRILRHPPAAEVFGRYWSDQLASGLCANPQLSAGHYLDVRFEDLIAEPARELARIARFFELPGAKDADEEIGWIERASSLVRGHPPLRLPQLEAGDRERLLEACAPGRAAIKDFGAPQPSSESPST